MVDLSWSQTPNSVWWALEVSTSVASLTGLGEDITSPHKRLGSELTANNFYDYADEAEVEEDEEELMEWVKEYAGRGIVR